MLDPAILNQRQLEMDAQAASLGDLADIRLCPKCQSDLTYLPASARYCPRCGYDRRQTVSVAGQAETPSTETQTPAVESEPLALPMPMGDEPRRSPILRGFASALYRLGRRYEARLGAANNQAEAQRCYYKAAKLGDHLAMNRLAGMAEDERPPEDE